MQHVPQAMMPHATDAQREKAMRPTITALVLTYNGERLLDRCLGSLAFCDRILVVDSFSTDATVAIAQAAGAEVLQRKWEGPGPQFAFALEKISDGWIVSLDQDEICSEQLRDSILAATAADSGKAGYWIPRRSWYFDRFLKHSGWYPDHLLRLFRTGRMRVEVSGAHYSFHPDGETGTLTGDILHYPYESFRQHLDKVNDYAQKGADDLRAKGNEMALQRLKDAAGQTGRSLCRALPRRGAFHSHLHHQARLSRWPCRVHQRNPRGLLRLPQAPAHRGRRLGTPLRTQVGHRHLLHATPTSGEGRNERTQVQARAAQTQRRGPCGREQVRYCPRHSFKDMP